MEGLNIPTIFLICHPPGLLPVLRPTDQWYFLWHFALCSSRVGSALIWNIKETGDIYLWLGFTQHYIILWKKCTFLHILLCIHFPIDTYFYLDSSILFVCPFAHTFLWAFTPIFTCTISKHFHTRFRSTFCTHLPKHFWKAILRSKLAFYTYILVLRFLLNGWMKRWDGIS